jgi:hypothetical protein
LILRSNVKGQTGHINILTTQYLENPFLERHQNLYTVHLKDLIKFYGHYNDLVCDYKLPLAHMLDDLFHTIG